MSEKAKVLLRNRYIRENDAKTMRKFKMNTIGEAIIRRNASTKLFLNAASRKIFIIKEYAVINISDAYEEHTSLSNFESADLRKPSTLANIRNTFVF